MLMLANKLWSIKKSNQFSKKTLCTEVYGQIFYFFQPAHLVKFSGPMCRHAEDLILIFEVSNFFYPKSQKSHTQHFLSTGYAWWTSSGTERRLSTSEEDLLHQWIEHFIGSEAKFFRSIWIEQCLFYQFKPRKRTI